MKKYQLTLLRLSILIPVFLLIAGCAGGLFIKGNQELAVKELVRTIDACNKNILGADFKQLEGKLLFDGGQKLSSSVFSNMQKPSTDEMVVILKLISNQNICEIKYLEWAQEHAPKAAQLTLTYSSLNTEIYKKLSSGAYTYGQATTGLYANLSEYLKYLKILEINISENDKERTKQLFRDYLVQSVIQDSSSSNGNLIVNCGGRGVNFVTKACN
jgi:hypothetical protein